MRINVLNDGEYDIPIIPQWEIYRYEPILHCECGHTEHGHNLVGIAEVRGEMMLCHECPKCKDKFRCHVTIPHDKWKEELMLILILYNPQFKLSSL